MGIMETLQALADLRRHHVRKEHFGPYTVRLHDGGAWLYASDGFSALFAEPVNVADPPPPPPESVAATLQRLAGPADVSDGRECDLGALREWAGVVADPVCPECKGTSARSEWVHCDRCEDSGEVLPGSGVEAPLFGHTVNRARLRRLLAPFPGPEVVRVLTSGEKLSPSGADVLWVVGGTFRAALAFEESRVPDADAVPFGAPETGADAPAVRHA
jgi:hypothetical protein